MHPVATWLPWVVLGLSPSTAGTQSGYHAGEEVSISSHTQELLNKDQFYSLIQNSGSGHAPFPIFP